MVVTRGKKGAVAVKGDEVVESHIHKNLKIVDLTGAGDLFASGFLHGYINKLLTNKTDKFMYNIPNPPQWDENKRNIMKKILLIKIKQYPEIFTTLINTGFRKIFYNSKYDFYWGLGDGTGSNELGTLWVEIREHIIITKGSV